MYMFDRVLKVYSVLSEARFHSVSISKKLLNK